MLRMRMCGQGLPEGSIGHVDIKAAASNVLRNAGGIDDIN